MGARKRWYWPAFGRYLLIALGCWVWWFGLAIGGVAEHLRPGAGFVFPWWVYLTIVVAVFVQYKCMKVIEYIIERSGGPVLKLNGKPVLGGPGDSDMGGVAQPPPPPSMYIDPREGPDDG